MSFGCYSNRLVATLLLFSALFSLKLHAGWIYEPSQGCCPSPCSAPDCADGYTPQYYGNCGDCDGISDRTIFRLDYLYWRPSGDSLELGVEETISVESDYSGDNRVHTVQLDFDYSSGARIGAMHILPCDGWDVSLNWIIFNSDASAEGVSTLAPGVASGVTPPVASTNTVFLNNFQHLTNYLYGTPGTMTPTPTQMVLLPDFAKGKWDLHLNLVDLELGRRFYLSPCLVARPFIGLRYASINQTYKVHSYAQRVSTTSIAAPFPAEFVDDAKSKNDFSGFGVRAGLDLDYKFGCGISIYGEAAASLLYGEFDRSDKEHADLIYQVSGVSGIVATPIDLDYHYHSKYRRSRAMTDLALGIRWEDCFSWCNCYHPFAVSLAWEHHAFYNINQFDYNHRYAFSLPTNTSQNSSGYLYQPGGRGTDLITQGLTLSVAFGF